MQGSELAAELASPMSSETSAMTCREGRIRGIQESQGCSGLTSIWVPQGHSAGRNFPQAIIESQVACYCMQVCGRVSYLKEPSERYGFRTRFRA